MRKTISSLQSPTAGAADALKSLGLSTKDFVGQDGKMKSMTEIFSILHDKTKGLAQSQQADIFHTLFGATGQAAGTILTNNAAALGELNKKVIESGEGQGYVHTLAQKNMETTKARLEQLKAIMEQVGMTVGNAMLPAIDKAAKRMADMFQSKEGQKMLKELANGVGDFLNKLVDLFIFLGEHKRVVEGFAIAMAAMFAVDKIGGFIGNMRNVKLSIEAATASAKEFSAVNMFSNMPKGFNPFSGKNPTPKVSKFDKVGLTGAALETATTRTERSAIKAAARTGGRVAAGAVAPAVASGVSGVAEGGAATIGIGAAAPFLAVAAAIAGIGLATKAAYDHIAYFKEFVNDTGKSIKDNFVDPIGKGFSYVRDSIVDVSKAFSKGFGKGFKSSMKFISNGMDSLRGAFTDVGNDIEKALKPVTKKGGALDGITDALNGIGNWFGAHKDVFTAIGKVLGQVFGGFLGTLAGIGTLFVRVFGNMIPPLIEGIIKLFKDLGTFLGGLIKTLAAIGAAIVHLFTGNWKALGKDLKDILDGITKMVAGVLKGLWDGITSVFKMGVKAVDGVIQTVFGTGKNPIEKWFKSVVKSVDKAFTSASKAARKGAKNLVNGTVKIFNNWKNGIAKIFSGAFKLVIDGFNGFVETLYKVTVWFINREIKGWENIWNGIKKVVGWIYDGVTSIFGKMWDVVSDIFKSIADFIGKTLSNMWTNWKHNWQNILDLFNEIWTGLKKVGSDSINWLKGTFDDILGKIGSAFKNTWEGVKNGFSDMWNGMKRLAQDGINAVIKIPNAGIDGINGLIHDFGGSKDTLGHIPEVKFANGTGVFSQQRNAITRPTLALLNDGYDSPETGNKEALIHPNGSMEVLEGRNINRLLMPGTEVINASELAMIMGEKAFAGGTGFFGTIWDGLKSAGSWVGKTAGNVWDGVQNGIEKFTKMFGFITDAVAHPIKTLESKFNPKAEGMGKMFNALGGVMFGKAKDQATGWWSELWSMAKSAGDSGAVGEQGDNYPWKNSGIDSAADPWGYFLRECVSYVANSLKNAGVSSSLFSGLGNGSDWVNAKVPHTKTPRPGMVAVYGPGSEFGNHVAMVRSVKGNTFGGEEYNWGRDGKYHKFSGRKASGATTFLDFGVSSSSDPEGISAKTPLQKHIKSQVGGMLDWIQKFIGPINDTSTGVGGDVQSWSNDVKKALSKLGLSTSGSMVSRVLRQIQTESGGNQKAIGGNDGLADGNATGLMQVKPGTFRAYALPGHNNIMNGYDNMLAGLNYAKSRYGSDLSFLGNGHGYANGGLITKHQVAEIGEGNQPEMIIPLDRMKSSRGFELLGRTAVAMAARDGHSISGTGGGDIEMLMQQNNQLLGQLTQLVGAILGESEKSNEPLGAIAMNKLSRNIINSAVRSAN